MKVMGSEAEPNTYAHSGMTPLGMEAGISMNSVAVSNDISTSDVPQAYFLGYISHYRSELKKWTQCQFAESIN